MYLLDCQCSASHRAGIFFPKMRKKVAVRGAGVV